MFNSIKNLFAKRRKFGKNDQVITSKRSGIRTLELDKGDALLILKEDGTSTFIDSGAKQLTDADELVAMVWCYLANPEFVKILRAMFAEIIDEINVDKMRDQMTIGRSGAYTMRDKKEPADVIVE